MSVRNASLTRDEFLSLMLGIYRTLHMTSFCGNATSVRSELLDRIVNLVEEPSKSFPVVEARRSKNIRKYTSHIAEIITELEMQDDRINRWIQPAESKYNNCVNDKPFVIEFDEGQYLMEFFPPKSQFTMAHHLHASQFKNSHGTCRNCSRELHSHTTDVNGLRTMNSMAHTLPNCSMKLKSSPGFEGFELKIKASIDPTGRRNLFRVEKITLSSSLMAAIFRNTLAKSTFIDIDKRNLISLAVNVPKRPVGYCRVNLQFINTKNEAESGSLKELIAQGFHPMFDRGKSDTAEGTHQTPFAKFLVEALQVISRTCNPLLFQNPESYLSFQEKEFHRLWDLYDTGVGNWPVLYTTLSDDLRHILNNELKVDNRYSNLGEVLLKHSKDKGEKGKIEFEIDPMQFWM